MKLILFTIFLGSLSFLRCQTVYGIRNFSNSTTPVFCSVDPVTGVSTDISNVPYSFFSNNVGGVIDPVNGLYITEGMQSINSSRYFSIDINAGTYVMSPPVSFDSTVLKMTFNCADETIYGIRNFSNTTTPIFCSLDPVTGIPTDIASIPYSFYSNNVGGVIDPVNGLYITEGMQSIDSARYFSIDISTGAYVMSPTVSLDSIVLKLAYNCADGTIYGIRNFSSTTTAIFCSLDPTTGVTTDIASVPHSYFSNNVGAVIDPISNVYITEGMTSIGQSQYFLIDISTGAYTTSPVLNASDVALKLSTPTPCQTAGNINYSGTCFGEVTNFQAPFALDYQWSFGDGNTSSIQNPAHLYGAPGTYNVELIIAGCFNTDTLNVQVVIDAVIDVDLGPDTTICFGDEYVLYSPSGSNNTWSNGSIEDSIVVDFPGTYSLQFVNGLCSSADTITVVFDSIPNVELGADTILCQGQSLVLTASSQGASYLWSNSSTNSTINVSQPGLYSVQLTSACGNSSDTVLIDYHEPIQIDLGNDTILCENQTLLLSVSDPTLDYLWQDNTPDLEMIASNSGYYWVEASNFCETVVDSINVNFIAPPLIDLGNDTSFCADSFLKLEGDPNMGSYSWSTGSTEYFIEINSPDTYSVELTNMCGSSFDEIQVTEIDCDCYPFVPNAFTPNGDAFNNGLKPIFSCDNVQFVMYIYNRWGELIIELNEINSTWDGTFKGLLVQAGVYTYVLEYKSGLVDAESITGHVTVLH